MSNSDANTIGFVSSLLEQSWSWCQILSGLPEQFACSVLILMPKKLGLPAQFSLPMQSWSWCQTHFGFTCTVCLCIPLAKYTLVFMHSLSVHSSYQIHFGLYAQFVYAFLMTNLFRFTCTVFLCIPHAKLALVYN